LGNEIAPRLIPLGIIAVLGDATGVGRSTAPVDRALATSTWMCPIVGVGSEGAPVDRVLAVTTWF
jgi:hypothetical protein